MTKQRLVSSKFEEDGGSPPWLVLSRAVRSNVERCGRFSFRLLICFRTEKKKEEKEERLTFGRHVLRTFVSASRLFSPPLPLVARNLSCILFHCTISKLIYHPLNKPILFYSHEFRSDNFVHNSTSLPSVDSTNNSTNNYKHQTIQFSSISLSNFSISTSIYLREH